MPNNTNSSPPMPIDKDNGLIVLGALRSGLSLMADCLRLLGIDAGGQQAAVVAGIHQQFCRDLGVDPMKAGSLPEGWEGSNAAKEAQRCIRDLLIALEKTCKPWMLADPFFCRVLPLWREALDELGIVPRIIHLLRHPWETAQSLAHTDQVDIETGHLIWLICNREAASARADYPYLLVTFDQLMTDPVTLLIKVKTILTMDYPNDIRSVYPELMRLFRWHNSPFEAGSATEEDRHTYCSFFRQFNEFRAIQPNASNREATLSINYITSELNNKIEQLDQCQTQLEQITKSRDEQAKLANERQAQIKQVKQVLGEKTKLSQDRQNQIAQLNKTRDEQASLEAERQAQLKQLTLDRDQKAKQLAERQTQVEQITTARNQQEKLASERQAQIEQLNQALGEKTQLSENRQNQIAQLAKARDEQAQLAAERQVQLQQLAQDRDQKAKQLAERQAQVEQVSKAGDAQAIVANERQAKIEQIKQALSEKVKQLAERQSQVKELTKAREEQVKLATTYQEQLKKLTQERDEKAKQLIDRQSQISKITVECDQQRKKSTERQTRIQQLEADLSEMEQRQQLLSEEMVKAEGQIDIIKEMLLQEPEL